MVGRCLALLAVAVAFLPLALPASAQSANPPHLDTQNNILYGHWDGGDLTYMNTLAVDSDDANYGSGTVVGGIPTVVTEMTWDFVLTPALAANVKLDTSKDATATMYIGGNAAAGQMSIETSLVSDTTVVWTGTSDDFEMTPGTATDYTTVVVSAKPSADTLPVGKPLHWIITASGASTASFLGMSEGRGRTNLELPVTSAAPDQVASADIKYGTLPAGPVNLDLSILNKTTATYHYNWTAPAGEQSIKVGATVKGGSVQVLVTDNANKTQFDQTLTASGNKTAQTKGAASGLWRITLRLVDYEGGLDLAIDPVSKAGGTTGPFGGTSGTGGSTAVVGGTGGTGGAAPGSTEQQGTSNNAPHLGVAALALGLALAAARRRIH
ncbi:MAG: hypothetical protein QOD77_2068 [Thermoplasmata archaeon]|jgi:hypothetical protein|nr:hypothetical protein [Thermoplasmata archaeon]